MSKCGTHAGWSEHSRKGEKCCPACSEYRRLYMRERRVRLASGRAFTYPLEVSAPDAYGLGSAIAQAIRESA